MYVPLTTDTTYIINHQKQTLEDMIKTIFPQVKMRWVDTYFPFTDPSYEQEIFYNNKWLEIVGCGKIHKKVQTESYRENSSGWAFGIGLDRQALLLYDIPDIRQLWSNDKRFQNQLIPDTIKPFVPYSKYPNTTRDISLWINNETNFCDNDIYALIRLYAGDNVEKVECIDVFINPKTKRKSKTYRITYCSFERTLENDEVNNWQNSIREALASLYDIQLR